MIDFGAISEKPVYFKRKHANEITIERFKSDDVALQKSTIFINYQFTIIFSTGYTQRRKDRLLPVRKLVTILITINKIFKETLILRIEV